MSKKPKMAICYDFDLTLSRSPMQENRFLPSVGVVSEEFWREVKSETDRNHADNILVYMKLTIDKANAAGKPIRRADFLDKGSGMQFWDGLDTWFDRINQHAEQQGAELKHYAISSGNREIIEGTSIANQFDRIYACQFYFDANDVAVWPALSVNQYVPLEERPIPFPNMVYIGDGETDIPCFRTVKSLGGLSLGVYSPHKRNGNATVRRLFQDNRIDAYYQADYSAGKALERTIFSAIDEVHARYMLRSSTRHV